MRFFPYNLRHEFVALVYCVCGAGPSDLQLVALGKLNRKIGRGVSIRANS